MRRYLIGVLLVSCVTWSRVGAAQGAPVRDDVVGGARAAQFMADWLAGYRTLARWREALSTRLDSAYATLDRADDLRWSTEVNRIGELTGYGQQVTDFRNWLPVLPGQSQLARLEERLLALPDSLRQVVTSPLAAFSASLTANAAIDSVLGLALAPLHRDARVQASLSQVARGVGAYAATTGDVADWLADFEHRFQGIDSLLATLPTQEGMETLTSTGRAAQAGVVIGMATARISADQATMEALALRASATQLYRERASQSGPAGWGVGLPMPAGRKP